jgi:ATP-dependent RNA helicase SUPV3L1/SUV3
MSRDEALTGLARGFAFRMVEGLGVLPRDAVADDVKALDQEARGALRKHGVRFGQFTVFLPLLLKPAPTRLRLVLWSLWNNLDEFPESPPPGLVTIPNIAEVPKQHYTLSGYHPAGSRAIRIDMLERLADILRTKDSRAGFEATADMLSITGMTLEQFSDLMAGLGYQGEKGERVKVKAAEPPKPEEPKSDQPIPEEVSVLAPVPEEPAAEEGPQEMEVFYTFTWAPKPRFQRPERGNRPQGQGDRANRGERPQGERPQGDRPKREGGDRPQGERREGGGKPQHGKPHGKGGKPERRDGGKPQGAKSFEARPPRAEKPIDPDNPFAVLAALKAKS